MLMDGLKTAFGPGNAFYAVSELDFQAPDFARIKDKDYQPAIEAGMEEQRREIRAIADDPAVATFENTVVAMERSGALFGRAMGVFGGIAGANTNATLQGVRQVLAPKLAAHGDSILLDAKLFGRVKAVYARQEDLSGEDRRLLEVTYLGFVHAGAELGDGEKERLKGLNEEIAALRNAFLSKLLAATLEGAFVTTDEGSLAGLTEAEIGAAAEAAKERGMDGYVLALQNTTQQPGLEALSVRETRRGLFERSWNRTQRGDANDTREIVVRLAGLRAEKAGLLGASSYAAWGLQDQMAKTPETALKFMEGLVAGVTETATREAGEIQAVIDAEGGGFALEAWDWEFYQERVRRARFDLDEAKVRPYFEVNRVLEEGVFFAAQELFGVSFRERGDLPVYQEDVRVFEVFDTTGETLALFYFDPFKRDNKNGGAWMGEFVGQSRLLGTVPVIYNVMNYQKPVAGAAALLSYDEVTTMFHEFGHALHGIFSDAVYPSLAGTAVARDFVEFPSQFNERWASYSTVFEQYARHYETGEAMPEEMREKLKRAAAFNEGYRKMEVLAAAQLDMQWHTLAVGAVAADMDAFEAAALDRVGMAMREIPPRYRSSYFAHIWGGGYAAGYYAYLWSEALDEEGWRWFEEHGGLTRANGDRFRAMVLSKGNTEELEGMYGAWVGGA